MMYFLVKNYASSKKYNTTSDKVTSDIKKEFDSKPVYNEKLLKTKIKSSGDKTTDFQDKEMSEAGSNHTCLAVITIDSILKKFNTGITGVLEVSSDDSNESEKE